VLHAPRDFLLWALIAGCAASLVATPLSGYLSDQIGRKRWYLIGTLAMGIFGFVYFAMLNSVVPGLIFLGITLSFMHGTVYGPQAALIAECFTPRLRYSGCSIGYHLASITSGGPARQERSEAPSGQRPDDRCGHYSQSARMQLPATMQPSAKRKAPAENNQASAFRRPASSAVSALIALC
jgi:Major Facilitator Superfamily